MSENPERRLALIKDLIVDARFNNYNYSPMDCARELCRLQKAPVVTIGNTVINGQPIVMLRKNVGFEDCVVIDCEAFINFGPFHLVIHPNGRRMEATFDIVYTRPSGILVPFVWALTHTCASRVKSAIENYIRGNKNGLATDIRNEENIRTGGESKSEL